MKIEDEICTAAKRGDLEAFKDLIARGADIKSRTAYFLQTPLHHAAENGHLEIVKFLIESGADKEAEGDENKTPIHFAVEKGHLDWSRQRSKG
jgi:ankyrin repeat protein